MYQVLLVDDEYHAVQGLLSGVDWDKFCIDKVHTAYNIRQAKEILETHAVDFMICDIEMPEGSGIDLLRWVREHRAEQEAVFLTCHSDFGFAQQAVQLGSLDYLLKPVRYNELEEVIQKALDKVEKRRQQDAFRRTYDHYYSLWKKHEPLIIERFWLDLLNRTLSSNPQDISNALQQRNIAYTEQMRFKPVLIGVHRWHRELSQRDEKIMEYAMRNAAAHTLVPGQDMGQVVQLSDRLLLAILTEGDTGGSGGGAGSGGKAELREKCRAYMQFCNRHFYCDVSCYIGQAVAIGGMIGMVGKLTGQHRNNVTSVNREFFADDCPAVDETELARKQSELPFMNEWAELLKQGERGRLLVEARKYLEGLRISGKANALLLRHFYQDFTQMMLYVLQLKDVKAHRIFADDLSPEQMTAATRSIVELDAWVAHMIELAGATIDEMEDSQTLVDKVKRYVAENLDQPLMRKDIATHVYLNQDYLAKLFKKKTGLALSDYIVNERMKAAKTMLENGAMPIGAVATSVGYSSFSYFSKTFKEQFGVTPQEYRAKLQS